MNQPGPIYDNAVKFVAATDVHELCGWLGIPLDPAAVQLSESLPGHTMQADLLVESEPGLISQVEFVTHVAADLPRRLVAYRARVMERHPDHSLQQHVLVLGRGKVAKQLRDAREFWMRVHVFYARDQDPADLLKRPSLAPLAVLARATGADERGALLRAALRAIGTDADLRHRAELTDTATTLAAIRLDRATIESIRKETDVPIDIRDTDLARSFVEEGIASGLRWRYGNDVRITQVAAELVRLPSERVDELVAASGSVDALVEALDHQ